MADKKPYSPPELVRYGSIVTLTAGGAGSGTDGGTAYMNRMGGNDGGGPPAMAGMSDQRSKTNLVRIGTHPMGFGLYLFDYKPEFQAAAGKRGQRQFGVLAQEVERVFPKAVRLGRHGLRLVDYRLLGILH